MTTEFETLPATTVTEYSREVKEDKMGSQLVLNATTKELAKFLLKLVIAAVPATVVVYLLYVFAYMVAIFTAQVIQ